MKNKEGQNVSDKNQEITFLMALERGETKRIWIADTSEKQTPLNSRHLWITDTSE